MSRINLDNIKTYHQQDTGDNYDSLAKFNRFFEKGFHDSQLNPLPLELDKIESVIICTDGLSRHLADFTLSLSPFFLHTSLEISTGFRLPIYANTHTLLIFLFSNPNSEELSSISQETANKSLPFLKLDYQNLPHTTGFLFGLFSRLHPSFSKELNTEDIFSTIEKSVAKLNREVEQSQNPAKLLAQKHSQKAVLVLGSGHLQGVSLFTSGLVTRWAKTFSLPLLLPEANYILENLFTYPIKVLGEYQVLVLKSDLYPQAVVTQVESATHTLAQKRINFSVLKPDSSDWFTQIFESLVFLCFFSYYLSIVNQANSQ